jgi:CDP-paratose 2-epimerase
MKILVTGSSGLIGSQAVRFFDAKSCDVIGIDNNLRADFFGPQGDTSAVLSALKADCKGFTHISEDIRNRALIAEILDEHRFDVIIHAAAQPSHDLAAKRPFDDFDVNATGTLNLLEGCRRYSPEATFVFLSSNKVYGDGPNKLEMAEGETRWDFAESKYAAGITENFPVDQCLHSLFGASKLAADILCQEYGRYFDMNVGVFRGGCLTGPLHSGVELHGFLNYLVKAAVEDIPYTIFGYKGKQVRDQIHSYDAINCFWHFIQNPKPGEVYNLGGGKENSASLLECVQKVENLCGKKMNITYQEQNRIGDHICYYSDLTKLRSHYPEWSITYSLDQIIQEMVEVLR